MALDNHTSTLEWAQGRAAEAIRQWNQAESATSQAKAQHDQNEQTAGHPLPFNDPGEAMRQAARDTLNSARTQLKIAGDTAASAIAAARDKAPAEPGFWDEVGDFFEDVGAGLLNATGTVVNSFASFGNAAIHHPLETGTMVAGVVLTALGATGEAGGGLLDATGVGAVAGVPLNVASAGAITGGLAMAAAGGGGINYDVPWKSTAYFPNKG